MKTRLNKIFIISIFMSFLMVLLPLNQVVSATYSITHKNLFLSINQDWGSDSCKVNTNIYAFVASLDKSYGKIVTKNIDDITGAISTSNISTYLFDNSYCINPHIISLENNYFLITYTGLTYTFRMIILYISPTGTISSPVYTHSAEYDCLNVERDMFYDSNTNIITTFYTNQNGKLAFIKTFEYFTYNHTVNDIDKYSLFQWNSTSGIVPYNTHVTAGRTFNIYTDFYAIISYQTGANYNLTGITFNVSSSGYVEYCDRVHKGSTILSQNFTTSCIGRMYDDKNFIIYSYSYSNQLSRFYISNQTGDIVYIGFTSLTVGIPHAINRIICIFQNDYNKISIAWDWACAAFFPVLLSNYSVDGTGTLTYLSSVDNIINPYGAVGQLYYTYFLRMTNTGRYLFTFEESFNDIIHLSNVINFLPSFSPPDVEQNLTEYNETIYCGYDMSLYNNVKQDDLSGQYTLTWTGTNIEDQYTISLTTTIQGVGLLVSGSQYLYDSNVLHYFLNLNGLSLQTADCIFQYSPNSYMIFWKTSVSLNNERPLFAFMHSQLLYGSTYWEFCGNPDGSTSNLAFPKFSTFPILFSDNVFNGNDYRYNSAEQIYGLQMTFWYGDIEIQNGTSHYEDMITTTKLNWYQYETVPIIWQVSNVLYDYVIQVWHNGSQLNTQGFPMTLLKSQFSGHESFVPLGTGNYEFRLLYNNVKIKSINITVEHAIQNNFIMYVYPNPCDFLANFNIGYRYYTTDGENGLITIDPTHSNNATNVEKFFIIQSNTSGNLTWQCSNNYWISMYKKVGSVYYSIPEVPDVYLGINELLNANTILVQYATKTINEGDSFTQRYHGSHGYYGQSVYVTLDNVIIGSNVGYTNFYSITSELLGSAAETEGYHIAKLVLQTVNGTIELANTTFSVTVIPSGQQVEENPFFALLGDYTYVFGIFIIVMFLLLPMTIASKLGVELPMIANLGSAALGLSFCVLAGILPLYVIFLTAVVMVVGGVIVIFTR